MTNNLIKEHHDKIQDKENRQKLSNKPGSISQGKYEPNGVLKKNRTSEGGLSRQGITQSSQNY